MIRLLPANDTLTSEGLARLYRDHIWKDFGLLGVQTNLSTAYHPETDGQTERVNQEIEQYWRNSRTTTMSPRRLGTRHSMRIMGSTHEHRHRASPPDYSIGDLVYVDGRHIRTDRPSRKRLQLPKTWRRIPPVFHTVHLRRYHPPVSPLQQKPMAPPPVDMGDHMEQEVEEILDERSRRGGTEYLVKWKGQPREENSWEPRGHLEDEHGINDKFQAYLNKRKLRVRIRIPVLNEDATRHDFEWTMPAIQGAYDWGSRRFCAVGPGLYVVEGDDAKRGGNVRNLERSGGDPEQAMRSREAGVTGQGGGSGNGG